MGLQKPLPARLLAPSFLLLSLAASLMAQGLAPAGRGITPEDYLVLESLGDSRISPDGSRVAYVVTHIDAKQNRRLSALWMTGTDGAGSPVQLTTGPQSASSPRWSPDGKSLAFISTRPGSSESPADTRPQLFVLSMQGGEARRVSSMKNGVSSCEWSPDGARFVCLGRTGPGDLRAEVKGRSDVRHYSRTNYKFNDSGWFDDRKSHVWIIDGTTGAARQITSGEDWNDTDPRWSPDGRRIAFVSDRSGKAFDESNNSDIWVVSADGGEPMRISDHDEADEGPRWSPDGTRIAFVGEVHERDHPKIWIASPQGGPSRSLVPDLDIIPEDLQWSADGRALFFSANVRGEDRIYRADVATGKATPVISGPRSIRGVSIDARTSRMTYSGSDFTHPSDLYSSDVKGMNEKKLTRLNEKMLSTIDLKDVERFTYAGADGWPVDAFFVRPVGWQPGRAYPMILSIHGGPAGAYGVAWNHEFQTYAARGWSVLFVNPRGSTGYGQRFERGIVGEWGGKDYIDVMKGVDAALARYSWIDSTRMGVTGGSYGGYLTNWIVGHTARFKAAVTLRSVSNFVSDEGTRDGAYGHTPDFGGDLFQKFDLYWDRSPLKYARNVTTPILILHSENDLRVPLEQGEQWFRALRHFGKTAEIVIFPRENHNLTRTGEPRHIVESLNWQQYWFDKYLNGNQAAVPPDQR